MEVQKKQFVVKRKKKDAKDVAGLINNVIIWPQTGTNTWKDAGMLVLPFTSFLITG